MLAQLRELVKTIEGNLTRFYLITANIVLAIFAIWFANVGFLPFKNVGDFVFFAILTLILALYRPGWTFVFFVGTLALENINLAPEALGMTLRPYQFFGSITVLALLVQIFSKRLPFALPKFRWFDMLPILFVMGSFFSALGSVGKGASLKQSVIAFSFVVLYFLVRIYVQSFKDLKRIAPFFLSSAIVVAAYGIWQNIAFLVGKNSFEVMPGRPNGTFTEADWLGMFLVFLLSVILTIIYSINKKSSGISHQSSKMQISKEGVMTDDRLLMTKKYAQQICSYILLILTLTTLILTVSRSAWVGAVFVVIVFLKFLLLENPNAIVFGNENRWRRFLLILKMNRWQWKKAGTQLLFVSIALAVSFLISIPLTRFEIGSRAQSTGGLQKITISCQGGSDNTVPQKINSVEELAKYNCRHINLEEIDAEKNASNVVSQVYRPDPNVNIRSQIYKKSWEQIKTHPLNGLGWSGISLVLGTDSRGAGLNASNIFLEVWLGSGLLGLLSFVGLILYILIASIGLFLKSSEKNLTSIAFVMLGWAAIVIPNLFNSGIFLGFVWVYLAVAVGLLSENKK